MSLSNTLDKLMHVLKSNAIFSEDLEEIFQRLIMELGELEVTVSELTDKIETLEDRQVNLEEQVSEMGERISELESNLPSLDE